MLSSKALGTRHHLVSIRCDIILSYIYIFCLCSLFQYEEKNVIKYCIDNLRSLSHGIFPTLPYLFPIYFTQRSRLLNYQYKRRGECDRMSHVSRATDRDKFRKETRLAPFSFCRLSKADEKCVTHHPQSHRQIWGEALSSRFIFCILLLALN